MKSSAKDQIQFNMQIRILLSYIGVYICICDATSCQFYV